MRVVPIHLTVLLMTATKEMYRYQWFYGNYQVEPKLTLRY